VVEKFLHLRTVATRSVIDIIVVLGHGVFSEIGYEFREILGKNGHGGV
jgi:hypothetical protein